MVIDTHDQAPGSLRTGAEVHTRLAAIAPDLDDRTEPSVTFGEGVQAQAFLLVQVSFAVARDFAEASVHAAAS
jgi:hypothetical protein